MNIDSYDLIIFGDFGVLTNTPFKDRQPLHMLPGRAEQCAWLQQDRATRGLAPLLFAVTGNKGGVAWAAQTEEQAEEEVRWTAAQIGSEHYRVCFACPTTKGGFERYADPELLTRRKPRPAMFEEIITALSIDPARVLIVDHYADSFPASKKLGTAWMAPSSFFAGAASYIGVSKEEVARELDLFDIDLALAQQEED